MTTDVVCRLHPHLLYETKAPFVLWKTAESSVVVDLSTGNFPHWCPYQGLNVPLVSLTGQSSLLSSFYRVWIRLTTCYATIIISWSSYTVKSPNSSILFCLKHDPFWCKHCVHSCVCFNLKHIYLIWGESLPWYIVSNGKRFTWR